MDSTFKKMYADPFREGKTPMPSEAVWPEEKTEGWYLAWCRYAFSLYCANDTYMGFGGQMSSGRTIAELRAYARGRQTVGRYRKILDPAFDAQNPNAANSSDLNVSWDNLQIYCKFRDVMLGKVGDAVFDPTVVAIDSVSAAEKNSRFFADKFLGDPRTKAVLAESGVLPEGATQEAAQRDSADVDALFKMGFYTHGVEATMRDAIEHSLDISRWPTVSMQRDEDIADIGCGCVHVFRNSSGHVQVEYVDPAQVVIPKSKYKDFRDADFCGIVESLSVRQLREKSELTAEQMEDVARKYCGKNGNPMSVTQTSSVGTFRMDWAKGGNSHLDHFRADVMTLYFVANECSNYVVGQRFDTGHRIFDKVASTSKMTPKDEAKGKRIATKSIQNVYKCKWIVGTDYIFDYGRTDSIVRVGEPGNKQALLPIVFWGEDKPSVTERAIPFIDSIQLAWLKLQSTKASMPPGPRLAIDMRLVQQTIDVAGRMLGVQEILSMYQAHGILLYSSMSEFSIPGQESPNSVPIRELPSGIEGDVNLLMNDIAFGINGIRDVTGVSEVADGSANPNDMLIGVMQGLDAASNNALKGPMKAAMAMYSMTVESIARKYQASVLYGDISIRHIPVQTNIVQFVHLNQDMFNRDFHFSVKPGPTEQQLQMMMQMVMEKRGSGELMEDGALMLFNMIRERDLAKAQYFLSMFVARAKAQKDAHQLQVIAAQSKHQAEANAVMEQQKAQTQAIAMEGEMRLEKMRGDNRLAEIREDGRLKMEFLTAERQMGFVEKKFDK